jgi:succinate dehydrogenase hydrophobic anchor subunit
MSTTRQSPIDSRTLAGRGVGALGIALAVNFALAFVALGQNLVASTQFFQYPAIAVWTLLGMAGATVVFGVLTRRSATPDWTFVRVAAVVLVLSFLPDIGLALTADSVRTSEAVGLMALHVSTAIVAVLALPETVFGR